MGRTAIVLLLVSGSLFADGVTGATAAFIESITSGNTDVRPSVATARDGRTMVTWVTFSVGSQVLNVAFLDASGALISGPSPLALGGSTPWSVDVAAASNTFMLVVDATVPAGTRRDILFYRFTSTGTALNNGIVNTQFLLDYFRPRVGGNVMGDFAVTFGALDPSIPFPNSAGIFVRRYDSTGAAIDAAPYVVSDPGNNFSRMDAPDVGIWPDRKVVVVWHDGIFGSGAGAANGPDGFGQAVVGRWYDSAMSPVTGVLVLTQTTANDQFEPLVATDDRDRCLVAWCGDVAPSLVDAWCRRFDSTGTALDTTDTNLSSSNTSSDQLVQGIAGTSNGEWIVTWQDVSSSLGQSAPRPSFTRLTQQGTIIESAFIETGGSSTEGMFFPRVSCDEYGNFIVAWQVQTGPVLGASAGSGVRVRSYKRNMISVSSTTPPVGGAISVFVDSPSDANNIYVVGLSGGNGPTPIDTRQLKLTYDSLLQFILNSGLNNTNGVFYNLAGTLDASGTTNLPGIFIPNLPSLSGVTVYLSFATGGGFSLPSGVNTISDGISITIQ